MVVVWLSVEGDWSEEFCLLSVVEVEVLGWLLSVVEVEVGVDTRVVGWSLSVPEILSLWSEQIKYK